jgi:hypothetical protein
MNYVMECYFKLVKHNNNLLPPARKQPAAKGTNPAPAGSPGRPWSSETHPRSVIYLTKSTLSSQLDAKISQRAMMMSKRQHGSHSVTSSGGKPFKTISIEGWSLVLENRERRQAKIEGMGGKRGWQIRENDFWFVAWFVNLVCQKFKGFRLKP